LSEERFQRQLQLTLLNSHLLVARGDEFKEILGMGVLAPVYKLTASAGHVEDVVVHSSARGRGIGKILMLEIIDAARCNLELESLTLTSDPNNPRRQVARELYRKLDFEERDGLFTLHFNI
jgi:ribosomal protein S18 acetylase RimI-like enzyme